MLWCEGEKSRLPVWLGADYRLKKPPYLGLGVKDSEPLPKKPSQEVVFTRKQAVSANQGSPGIRSGWLQRSQSGHFFLCHPVPPQTLHPPPPCRPSSPLFSFISRCSTKSAPSFSLWLYFPNRFIRAPWLKRARTRACTHKHSLTYSLAEGHISPDVNRLSSARIRGAARRW